MTQHEELMAELVEALELFVGHGRACGAFGNEEHPHFRVMTDEGYREIPAEDFRRARDVAARATTLSKTLG